MPIVPKPNTYQAGTTITASAQNENEDALYNAINGNLDNANIKAAAAIAQSKLALSITNAQVNASAAIALSKLATTGTLTSTNLSDGTTTVTTTALSGGSITVIFDEGGGVLTVDSLHRVYVPIPITIQQVTMGTNESGSIVIDIWKDTQANYPPTEGDSIVASAPPTISASNHSQDSTLTGWTTSVAAGSWLFFSIASVTDITYLSLTLKVKKV